MARTADPEQCSGRHTARPCGSERIAKDSGDQGQSRQSGILRGERRRDPAHPRKAGPLLSESPVTQDVTVFGGVGGCTQLCSRLSTDCELRELSWWAGELMNSGQLRAV